MKFSNAMHSASCRRLSQWALAAAAFAVLPATAIGAESPADIAAYPNKPVTLMLGYPPGGINDAIARKLAAEMTTAMGVTVLVDNRAGANGAIAANQVAKSKPDGYTVMFGAIGQVSVNQFLRNDMPYANSDLIPVAKVAEGANVLVVNAAKAAQYPNVAKLIEAAKQQPGKLSYGSFGIGSSSHLSAELFGKQANIKALHVPYKGSAPAMVDLIGGNLDFMFDSINTALPHIKSGKVVALAVTRPTRSAALPKVPTFVESGLPQFKVASWFGIHLPRGTPPEIVKKLNAAVRAAQAKPEFIEYFKQQSIDITQSTPEQYGTFVASEDKRWGSLIKELNIKAE